MNFLPPSIDTHRMLLVTMPTRFLRLCVDGERVEAEMCLGYKLHDSWWEEGELMRLRIGQLLKDPSLEPWQLRAMILKASGQMIGHFNGHTAPGARYLKEFTSLRAIEIGFTVYPEFRRQGFAEEAVEAYSAALRHTGQVETVALSITPGDQAMLGLVNKLGFLEAGRARDEDGEEIVYLRNIGDERKAK